MTNNDYDDDRKTLERPTSAWVYGVNQPYSARIDKNGKGAVCAGLRTVTRIGGNLFASVTPVIDELNGLAEELERSRGEYLSLREDCGQRWQLTIEPGVWHTDTEPKSQFTRYVYSTEARPRWLVFSSDRMTFDQVRVLVDFLNKATHKPFNAEVLSEYMGSSIALDCADSTLMVFERSELTEVQATMLLGLLNSFDVNPEIK